MWLCQLQRTGSGCGCYECTDLLREHDLCRTMTEFRERRAEIEMKQNRVKQKEAAEGKEEETKSRSSQKEARLEEKTKQIWREGECRVKQREN